MLGDELKRRLQRRFHYTARSITLELSLRKALDTYLQSGIVVLDAGCGRGWIWRQHRDLPRLIIGLDVEVTEQTEIKNFVAGNLEKLPFPDDTFDLVVCNDVIEHLARPQTVFGEFARVLKEDGLFIFRTPCVGSPVVRLMSLLPFRFRRYIKSRLYGDLECFPTYYRCNTERALESVLVKLGFRRKKLFMADTSYEMLAFSRVSYALGLLFSHTMQRPFFRPFRNQILGVYVKAENPIRFTAEDASSAPAK